MEIFILMDANKLTEHDKVEALPSLVLWSKIETTESRS